MKFRTGFLFILLVWDVSHSQTLNANTFFREQALKLPLEIINSCNLKQVEGIDLEKLIKTAQSLNWQFIPKEVGIISDADGKERMWAIYDRHHGIVSVNETTLLNIVNSRQRKSLIPLMALHETFRHMGIDDEDYQATLALLWSSAVCRSENVGEAAGLSFKIAGGATSTGGGGNDMALWTKVQVLMSLAPQLEKDYPTILEYYPKLKHIKKEILIAAILNSKVETYLALKGPQVIYVAKVNGEKVYKIPQLIFEINDENSMFIIANKYLELLLEDL